uniref:Uncharacterized protein n=1 Tax=Anguilla anguilla TaxID=7936 RepID=A0A0E9TNQ1_ANGAN
MEYSELSIMASMQYTKLRTTSGMQYPEHYEQYLVQQAV